MNRRAAGKSYPIRAAIVMGAFVGALGANGQTVLFVSADRPPGGDGLGWVTAYDDLQDALDHARSDPDVSEIWVADGTYKPDRGTGDRDASFVLVTGVAVLGGFAGDESEATQRDPQTHLTVLSGDLAGDDLPGFVGYADNSRHVVTATGTGLDTTIDGLTVTAGNGDFDGSLLLGGGGLFVLDGSASVFGCRFTANSVGIGAPTLGNFGGAVYLKNGGTLLVSGCSFTNNRSNNGGALGSLGSADAIQQVTLADCDFIENHADDQVGGAVYLAWGEHVVERCRFIDNEADYGGAIFGVLASRIEIRASHFTGNEGTVRAGAIWFDRCDDNDATPAVFGQCTFTDSFCEGGMGGAVRLDETVVHMTDCAFLGNVSLRVNPFSGALEGSFGGVFVNFEAGHQFINCLFSGNHAATNGGLGLSRASATLTNCTIAHNTSGLAVSGAGLLLDRSSVLVNNSILWGNRSDTLGGESAQIGLASSAATVRFSAIEGLTRGLGGVGNIGSDPQFVDAAGSDGQFGTADDNLRLSSGSPAIDAADRLAVPAGIVLDLDGEARFVDDPATADTGMGPAPIVDMGAYEFQVASGGCDSSAACPNADVNCDDIADGFDIAVVRSAANWLLPTGDAAEPRADVSGDGVIDGFDVAMIRSPECWLR